MKKTLLFSFVFLFVTQVHSSTLLNVFDSLFRSPAVQQSAVLNAMVQKMVDGKNLQPASINLIREVVFYHCLLTSSNAQNGNRYGALQLPYFWNYGAVNPRDSIYLIAANKPLRKCPPPKGFEKYQSYASVDRTPLLFWSDVATDEPKYKWRGISFHSFGWCSEREMAFKALMVTKQLKTSICFEGIHVWNEIVLPNDSNFVLKIDNTFNECVLISSKNKTKENLSDKYLTWYNSVSKSPAMIQSLLKVVVSAKRANEIEQQVMSFFKK